MMVLLLCTLTGCGPDSLHLNKEHLLIINDTCKNNDDLDYFTTRFNFVINVVCKDKAKFKYYLTDEKMVKQ